MFPILKADLHIHSNSRKRLTYCPLLYDSVQTVEDIVCQALKKDIKILAITDHDSLTGYFEAKKIIDTRKLDLVLIPGCEITSAEGHILAYDIQEEIPKGKSARETIDRIHDQGGYAVAAHPFFHSSLKERVYKLPLDALEGFNATTCLYANLKSIDAADQLGLPYLANSDAHQIEEIGRSYLLLPNNTENAADLFRHLRSFNYETSFGRSNSLQLIWRHLYRNAKLQLSTSKPSHSAPTAI